MCQRVRLGRTGLLLGGVLLAWLLGTAVITLLAAGPAGAAGSVRAPGAWVRFRVMTGTLRAAAVFENQIAWSQYAACGGTERGENGRIPEEPWDICLYDLATGELTTAYAGGNLTNPDLDAAWLVLDKNAYSGSVIAHHRESGADVMLAKAADYRAAPRVAGSWLWYKPDGQALWLYDLAQGTWRLVAADADGGAVSGDRMVWSAAAGGDYDVFGLDLQTQQPFSVTNRPGDEYGVVMDGDVVLWLWQGDIRGLDLATGTPLTVTADTAVQRSLAFSNGIAAWLDDRHGGWDVYARDLATGHEWRVTPTTDPGVIQTLDIWDGVIVWTRGDVFWEGDAIWAARLTTEAVYLPLILANREP